MASEFDSTDFVDSDFVTTPKSPYATTTTTATAPPASPVSSPAPIVMNRPPSREELDTRMGDAQQKLAELKRVQEELERERAALEEARRRRSEFQTGREEMLHSLARGVGLLEEAEFTARRDAEQMARTLTDLRDALAKVQAIKDEAWTEENWNLELTRALTVIENSRMEWNASRLKWPLLNGETAATPASATPKHVDSPLAGKSFAELCKLGLALTWPLAVVALLALGVFALLLLRK